MKLVEFKDPITTVEQAYQYHIDKKIPFRENIFRPGSKNFFELFQYARKKYDEGELRVDWHDAELLETDIGAVLKTKSGKLIALDLPFEEIIDEASCGEKGLKPNSPKRGGSKKFYVYVNDPKTGNCKKVSWGDTTGLSVKASKPGRVKSFVARHKCKQKKDKTKAGYWACRTPRYKSLGVKGGQWW
jgi:hypothetical protein